MILEAFKLFALLEVIVGWKLLAAFRGCSQNVMDGVSSINAGFGSVSWVLRAAS